MTPELSHQDQSPERGDSSALLVEDDGAVRTLALNRPAKKNAIDLPLWHELREALAAALDDAHVRVIVLTGTGDSFCSGADLGATRVGHPLTRMRVISSVAQLLHDSPKPTIARVNGVAVGGGWNLALCCDFVIASETATFSQIFPRRGLSLDVGGSYLLPRLVGLQKAKLLAMLGDRISALDAEQLGLATAVVPPSDLDRTVHHLAERLAAGPPVALSLTKSLLQHGVGRSFSEALESEAQAQTVNFAGHDAQAGLAAFQARTEPEFTGGWRLAPTNEDDTST